MNNTDTIALKLIHILFKQNLIDAEVYQSIIYKYS